MNQNELNDKVLDEYQVAAVSGGNARDDGETFGKFIGEVYWGARNYLSDTVYPYWLD